MLSKRYLLFRVKGRPTDLWDNAVKLIGLSRG